MTFIHSNSQALYGELQGRDSADNYLRLDDFGDVLAFVIRMDANLAEDDDEADEDEADDEAGDETGEVDVDDRSFIYECI
jgi:hypothetical protein